MLKDSEQFTLSPDQQGHAFPCADRGLFHACLLLWPSLEHQTNPFCVKPMQRPPEGGLPALRTLYLHLPENFRNFLSVVELLSSLPGIGDQTRKRINQEGMKTM